MGPLHPLDGYTKCGELRRHVRKVEKVRWGQWSLQHWAAATGKQEQLQELIDRRARVLIDETRQLVQQLWDSHHLEWSLHYATKQLRRELVHEAINARMLEGFKREALKARSV